MRNSSKYKKIITVHLGSGSSVTGWIQNNTVFHSMGFSPNEGMVMMTRSGSIDNGIILYLLREGYSANQIDNILEHESGMNAICGESDFKTIIDKMKKGNEYEKAYNAFVNSAAENILRATVYTGKPEQIIFAGSIGENSKKTINDIMKKTLLTIKIMQYITDEEKIMIEEALKLINHKS
jgi:acetate kinase